MSDEKYTDEYVLSMLNVWDDGFEGSLSARAQMIIVNTIQELPRHVTDEVLVGAIFVTLCGSYGASLTQYIELRKEAQLLELPKDRKYVKIEVDSILLNFALMEKDELEEEKMRSIIAHEIAHFYLEHHQTSVIPRAVKEKEADDLIEKWGFARAYS